MEESMQAGIRQIEPENLDSWMCCVEVEHMCGPTLLCETWRDVAARVGRKRVVVIEEERKEEENSRFIDTLCMVEAYVSLYLVKDDPARSRQ